MSLAIETEDAATPEVEAIPLETRQEYSRRKQELEHLGLKSWEYYAEVQKIADELGI